MRETSLARTLPAFTPVPRKKDRSNGWKPQVQHAFIEALAETGSVAAAARRVNRAPEGAYLLRRHPEAGSFRKAWEAALDIGMSRVEDVAMDRALNGVEVPVYSYGKLVGTRTIYNDRLLMFMLRNRAPGRFAADGAKGLNALDKHRLAEEKKAWRKEWERDRIAHSKTDRAATLARLNAKIDAMRERREAMMSPETLRLKAAFEASFEHDRAHPFHWLDAAAPCPGSEDDDAAIPGPSPEQIPLLPDRTPPERDDGWEVLRDPDPFGQDARARMRRDAGEDE
ncbi:hypothetical protein [Aurantiacibacter gangjinensis]|uniref:hypothetical protein n=1 Tax=Aurantiacibacter gangjinensis TaxID=502682 RepID=UPI00069AD33E|nr:hypothetical protein [Aurantiacibacter gangjinensis]APE28512.1 hypothetical protein BMF35_a1683 [Aurantiacibacter gangjinensis]